MDFIGKDGWPAPKLKVATAVMVRTVAFLLERMVGLLQNLR
jgi:serine/threonine-protein kinase RIO1